MKDWLGSHDNKNMGGKSGEGMMQVYRLFISRREEDALWRQRDSSWKTDLIWSRLNLRRVQSFFLSCEPSADCSHTWSQVVITQPVQEHKLSSLSHRQVWLVFSLDSTRAHPMSVPETDFREHRSRSSTNTGIIRDMILCNQRCVRKTKPVNVKL